MFSSRRKIKSRPVEGGTTEAFFALLWVPLLSVFFGLQRYLLVELMFACTCLYLSNEAVHFKVKLEHLFSA
jgi:hypothetical protein